jgi:hypothetical protein
VAARAPYFSNANPQRQTDSGISAMFNCQANFSSYPADKGAKIVEY